MSDRPACPFVVHGASSVGVVRFSVTMCCRSLGPYLPISIIAGSDLRTRLYLTHIPGIGTMCMWRGVPTSLRLGAELPAAPRRNPTPVSPPIRYGNYRQVRTERPEKVNSLRPEKSIRIRIGSADSSHAYLPPRAGVRHIYNAHPLALHHTSDRTAE